MSHFIPGEAENPEFNTLDDDILSQKRKALLPKLQSSRCFVSEWILDDHPLQNSSKGVEGILQNMYDLGIVPDFKDFLAEHNAKLAKHTKKGDDAPVPPKQNVLIFTDNCGFVDAILEYVELDFPMGRVKVVNDDPADIDEKSLKNLIGTGNNWDLFIFACGIDGPETNDVEDIHAAQDGVCKLFMTLCKECITNKEARVPKLAVITCDTFVYDTELATELGVKLITNSFLFGLCNTARMEMPGTKIQFIDTDYEFSAKTIRGLAIEIFDTAGFGTNNVRITEAGRYVNRMMTSERYEIRKKVFPMPTTGIILITGGNGALGLLMGQWLLGQYEKVVKRDGPPAAGTPPLTIKFLSRSMKISDEQTWKDIERKANALGVTCEQDKCDAGSRDSVEALVVKCEGRISGIIHSAGVLQDSMLQNQTWEKFCAVFQPKSKAALYFHDALERHANPLLAFFWMFSSIAAAGSPGQSPYSASNSVLDALCRYRRAVGKPALAIQWAGWGEVGMAKNMDEQSRKRMAASVMPAFTNAEGFEGLEHGLATDLPGICVLKYNAQTVAEGVKVLKDAASCHFRNFVDEIVPIPTFDKAGYWKQLRTMNSTQKQKMDPQMMKRWVHIEPDLSDHAGWGPNGRRTAQA